MYIDKISAELNVLFNKMGENMETIEHYIHLKRKENADIKNVVKLISQFLKKSNSGYLAAELGLHGFCACMTSRLSDVTKQMYGEAVWEKIFGDIKTPKNTWTDLTQTERKDFIQSVQEKFISVTSINDYKKALETIAGTWVTNDEVDITEKEKITLKDLDDYIKKCNDDYINYHGTVGDTTKKQHRENWKIRREGSKVIVKQVPFLMEKYLLETDDKMKRYYACRCPWVRAAILKGGTVSSLMCHCSLGYQTGFLETFFGRKLDGRIVSTVLSEGVHECVFEVDIPDNVSET